MKQKAIFLDRDGTIIKEKHFLSNPEEVELEKTVVEALKKLKAAGFMLIMVTNQSGIARGYFKVSQFLAVQSRLLDQLKEHELDFAEFYYCPHHPTKGKGKFLKKCTCRKPAPGMLYKGIRKFNIDPSKSFMIGDRQGDIDAGHNAGMKSILVKTGYGEKAATQKTCRPDFTAETLRDAVDYILK